MTHALAFSATFGQIPGYEGLATKQVDTIITDAWHDAMERERANSGILISAVLTPARVVYPTQFGCPQDGEIAVQVTGQSNPTFCSDTVAYGLAVARVCDTVRRALKQETVLLSIWSVQAGDVPARLEGGGLMVRPVYPYKPGDWVATEHGRIAKVKHVWDDGQAPVLLDLVIFNRLGKPVGRESPAMGGPRSFEPACDPEGWIRISEPSFPLELRWVTEDGVTTARWGTGRPLPPANWSPRERRTAPRPLAVSSFTQVELAHLATLLAQANDPISAEIGRKAAQFSQKDTRS